MKKAIKDKMKKIWRYPLVRSMTRRTKNSEVRIIASNCIGGILYHDMGKAFSSPTINCTVSGMDFINLCRNPEYYMLQTPTLDSVSTQGYPIANVGGINVSAVHYKDISDFSAQWKRRADRFMNSKDYEIIVITCDAQIKTEEEIEAFKSLPYRKICFTCNKNINHKDFVYVPGYDGQDAVGDLTRYKGIVGKRIFEYYFDFVRFVNESCN